jgi:predicted AlkP superfamily phosphohydrolase/phosphomutase
MNRSLYCAIACIAVSGGALGLWASDSSGQSNASSKPKTILLGFDGVDAELTSQWMAEGHLPNLKKLSEQGTYSPLVTANPAQSPVSWAVLETASNPGKTNIGDFVRRKIDPKSEVPMPALQGVEKRYVAPETVGDYVKGLTKAERFVFSLGVPATARKWTVIFAVASLLVAFVLFRFVFRLGKIGALLVSLLFGVAAGTAMKVLTDSIPPRVPVPINERQGKPFWDVLGESGVRFTGLQVPAAFPAFANENVKLLGGLFVPDVQGGPGSWSIYTNDQWEYSKPEGNSTETGGKVFKVYEEKDGVIRTKLNGPENFAVEQPFKVQLDALDAQLDEQGMNEATKSKLEDERRRVQSEYKAWKQSGNRVQVDMAIKPDYAAKKAAITIDGQTQTVEMGGWSDWFHITFKLNRILKLKAVGRIHVAQCMIDKNEDRRLDLFVPPISISPEWQPPILPISWPREFAAQIAEDCGTYDTIGWACWTNALKDGKISEQAFMDSLDFTLKWRTKQLERELNNKDWDVLFHVESVTDRAGHLLFRFIDPKHPQYDTKADDGSLLRDRLVKAYGRTFPLKDGIVETYKEMDRIVGEVMTRIEKGEFGPDARLVVVSDHGFEPFRYGVNLNVWLWEEGYLVLKDQKETWSNRAEMLTKLDTTGELKTGGTVDVGKIIDNDTAGNLEYVDWARTKAYAIGLGKIYINKKTRETGGIVAPADFDATVDEICARLESSLDQKRDQARIALRAYAGRKIYNGPYSEEPGDIVLGFGVGYRSSWQSTLGGFERGAIGNQGIIVNDQAWTGDHCGVDPSLVKGIFFSNKKMALEAEPSLLHIAPTICSFYGVATPPEWDGTPLKLAQ